MRKIFAMIAATTLLGCVNPAKETPVSVIAVTFATYNTDNRIISVNFSTNDTTLIASQNYSKDIACWRADNNIFIRAIATPTDNLIPNTATLSCLVTGITPGTYSVVDWLTSKPIAKLDITANEPIVAVSPAPQE